jgi:hypothetical protein
LATTVSWPALVAHFGVVSLPMDGLDLQPVERSLSASVGAIELLGNHALHAEFRARVEHVA